MVQWTKDYEKYIKWALINILDFFYLFDYKLDANEVDSAAFGYWYCEVRK